MNLSQRTRARRALAPALALFFLVLLSEPAWAYLDPGTGSMIISAVVGLFATVGLAVKTYWYKIRGFFRRDATDQASDGKPAAANDAEQDAEAQRSTET
jgi:uncharacterized iron-regulated membrane protein